MNNDSSSHSVSALMASLAGAALGAVVVALTTPKRGAELRNDLARLGGEAKEHMDEEVETAAEAMKAQAESVADKGQSAWKEVKKGTVMGGNEIKDGFAAAGKELRS